MKVLALLYKLPLSVKIACFALIVLFIYLSVAKIDIVSPGSGVITGSEDKIDITSSGSGFINKFDLKSGSKVQRGEVLFSYTNLDSYYKEKSLADLVEFSGQRIVELETDLKLLNFLKLYEFPTDDQHEHMDIAHIDVITDPGNDTSTKADKPDSGQSQDKNQDNLIQNNISQDNPTDPSPPQDQAKTADDNPIDPSTQQDQHQPETAPADADSDTDTDKPAAEANPQKTAADNPDKNTEKSKNKADNPSPAKVAAANTPTASAATAPIPAPASASAAKVKSVPEDSAKAIHEAQKNLLAALDKIFSRYTQDQTLTAFKFYQEYKSIINEKENQYKRQQETNLGIAELSTQIAMLNNKESLLRRSGAPQVDLINTGSDISKIRSQIIQERISLLSLENDMMRTRRDFDDRLLSRIYDADQQLAKLKKEQIENMGELELLKNKIESNSVLAPVDGVVLDIVKNFTEGSFVEQSQLIMKLKKTQVKKVVEAKFDAKYRPFIYNDGIVKVVINTPGYKKYYTGHIEKISADSFTDDRTHLTSRFYKVEIRVDNENFNLNNNSEGIQVSVYAISKRMTIISYLTALVNSNIVFNVW